MPIPVLNEKQMGDLKGMLNQRKVIDLTGNPGAKSMRLPQMPEEEKEQELPDLSVSVENGTASISLTGSTETVDFVQGENVEITGNTHSGGKVDVIIAATGSTASTPTNMVFPNWSNTGHDISRELDGGTYNNGDHSASFTTEGDGYLYAFGEITHYSANDAYGAVHVVVNGAKFKVVSLKSIFYGLDHSLSVGSGISFPVSAGSTVYLEVESYLIDYPNNQERLTPFDDNVGNPFYFKAGLVFYQTGPTVSQSNAQTGE